MKEFETAFEKICKSTDKDFNLNTFNAENRVLYNNIMNSMQAAYIAGFDFTSTMNIKNRLNNKN